MENDLTKEISIGDKRILHFSSFTLQQRFNAHHYFELRFKHDQLGAPGLISLDSSRDFVGQTLTASFGYDQAKMQKFSGMVTKVELAQSNGYHGILIVSGYSPTILIDRGPDLGSYLDKDLNSIVKLATKDTPANDLRIVANASRSSSIDYVIQYRESDFDFLNRLSGEYHEWFFYDGENLNFGKPDEQKEVALFYGRDVQSLQYAMEVAPIKNKRFAYNPKQDQMLESESTGKADGRPDLVHAINASNLMYSKTFNQPSLIRVDNGSDIKSLVDNEEKANISGLLKINANGDNPEVGIGSIAEVSMSLKQGLDFSAQSLGKFLITSVHHIIDERGHYNNSFEGVVSTTERLAFKNYERPHPDMQLADVVDNNDPQGQGRIKVKFKWQCQTNDQTEWLRVVTPDAGGSEKVSKNRGFVFIPEVGDQVLVAFEEGNIARPLVMGSVFHGKTGSGGSASNNTKSLTSKSGHTVQLDDGGGMTIRDKDENLIILDGAGNISMHSKISITISCGEGESAASAITLDKDGNIAIKSKNIVALGSELVSMGSGSGDEKSFSGSGFSLDPENVTIGAKTKLSMVGGKSLEAGSEGPVMIQAKGETIVQGAKVNIN
ncbi:type IV secretion protein Rhs [Pedobacter sp. KBW06]|uniref:type VI secretion system Vgr family protein n=1 Tax=Pedobacter sp. KBW06 TaxID=2153359 RepID=UPI000F5ABD4D|nr:phage baseplate assembly protein V [Pedobacter sp. KBW06]RQO75732.1 type IV secretion protein Rhs [Pedobacter sp. KBW06]